METVRLFPTTGMVLLPDAEQSVIEFFNEYAHTEESDVNEEIVTEGELIIFYSPSMYKDEEVPLNSVFEDIARAKAPYAPHFRGPLVVMDRRGFDADRFAEECAAKWAEPRLPSAEDIPAEMVPYFLNADPAPVADESTTVYIKKE